MLYTVDFEYRGGTYLSQVEANSPGEVLDLWARQIADKEVVRWGLDRAALIEAFGREVPVPIEGLVGVWCVGRDLDCRLALANFIATTETTTVPVELTSTELAIIQNALNEVCNGVALEGEFETRMGSSPEAARSLLHRLSKL